MFFDGSKPGSTSNLPLYYPFNKVIPWTPCSWRGGNTLPHYYMERLSMFQKSSTLIFTKYWQGMISNVDIWCNLTKKVSNTSVNSDSMEYSILVGW
jgi:hypothetical protein